jgi:hypothetical protein
MDDPRILEEIGPYEERICGQRQLDATVRRGWVKLLVGMGAKVNVEAVGVGCSSSCQPLSLALQIKDPEIVKLLSKAGAHD